MIAPIRLLLCRAGSCRRRRRADRRCLRRWPESARGVTLVDRRRCFPCVLALLPVRARRRATRRSLSSRSCRACRWPSRSSRSACCSRWSPRRCGSSTRSTRSATCAPTPSRARPLLCLLRAGAGATMGIAFAAQPVHAVPVLRAADARRPIRSSPITATTKRVRGGPASISACCWAPRSCSCCRRSSCTWLLAGTHRLHARRHPRRQARRRALGVLLALYVFGIGKAARDAVASLAACGDGRADAGHRALLHAVAVVKAGVFASSR